MSGAGPMLIDKFEVSASEDGDDAFVFVELGGIKFVLTARTASALGGQLTQKATEADHNRRQFWTRQS